jgi:hypothetical protein
LFGAACRTTQGIETSGFQKERDTSILETIYGTDTYGRHALGEEYSTWLGTAEAPEQEREREGYATPDECKQNVLDGIDTEIRHLKVSRKRRMTFESQEKEIAQLRRNVPDSPSLDRLLRYEASLERAFDRTLAQLERIQGLRQGQPVTPRIDVNVSA